MLQNIKESSAEAPEASTNPGMTAKDVFGLYQELNNLGIIIWVDGGWGVDALLGKQTRAHKDLDIAMYWKDVPHLRKLLIEKGYKQIKEDSQWNFVFADDQGRQIDIHAFIANDDGKVVEGIKYPDGSLDGSGTIENQAVRCISPEWMIKFHSGYELTEKDYQDVSALCEKYDIELPKEYEIFKQQE